MPSPSTAFSSTNPLPPRVVGIGYAIFQTPTDPVNPTTFTAPANYSLFISKDAAPTQDLGVSGDWALRPTADSIVLYQKTNIWTPFTTITGAASADLTSIYTELSNLESEFTNLSASVSTIASTYATQGYVLARKAEAITASNGYADAKVLIESTARAAANGFLEGKYTLTVQAGNVITGMNITSSTGAGTDVSEVIFRADKFQIWNGASSQAVFSLDGTDVTISGWKINPSTLTGGNVTLNSVGVVTVGTGNDVAIMSAADATYRFWSGHAVPTSASFSVTKAGIMFATGGTFSGNAYIGMTKETTLGVSQLSQVNGPLELFGFGNGGISSCNVFGRAVGGTQAAKAVALAGSNFGMNGRAWDGATFPDYGRISVTLLNNANVNQSSIFDVYTKNASNQNQYLEFNQDGRLTLANTGSGPTLFSGRINIENAGTTPSDGIYFGIDVNLYRDGPNALRTDDDFECIDIVASNISGAGAGITSLNASNISSGTLDNARLAFSVGNLASMNISAQTITAVATNGYVTIGGIKLATVA
jgi:hypothetical protein